MGGLLHLIQRGGSTPRPLIAVPNVTAHPSTASVSTTALLYDGPLLCGFNEENATTPTLEQQRKRNKIEI